MDSPILPAAAKAAATTEKGTGDKALATQSPELSARFRDALAASVARQSGPAAGTEAGQSGNLLPGVAASGEAALGASGTAAILDGLSGQAEATAESAINSELKGQSTAGEQPQLPAPSSGVAGQGLDVALAASEQRSDTATEVLAGLLAGNMPGKAGQPVGQNPTPANPEQALAAAASGGDKSGQKGFSAATIPGVGQSASGEAMGGKPTLGQAGLSAQSQWLNPDSAAQPTVAVNVAASTNANTNAAAPLGAIANPLVQTAPTTAATQGTTAIGVGVGQPGWDQAVGERVLWAVSQRLSTVQVKLNPANLGPLDIQLNLQQDQLSVSLVSQHAPVRELLDQALPRLRELLAESGLNLVDVGVSDQTPDQGLASNSADSDDGQGIGGNDGDSDELASSDGEGADSKPRPRGLLDTFA